MDETELDHWRELAAAKLADQSGRALRYQTYYDGDEDVQGMLNTEERRAFKAFLEESESNWCELVVRAVAERMKVTGFRFADGGGDRAWAIWQASHMDADARLVQRDALVTSSSCVLVQPDADNPTGVAITAESPFESCVLYVPGSRRRRAAGFKRFASSPGKTTDVLVLPDVIATWHPDEDDPELAPNPAGEVGMIEIVPQPVTSGWPRSELKAAIPIQDRINTTLFARGVAADYGAFRQIHVAGLRMARQTITSEDGTETVKAVRPFNVGPDRLLVSEDPATKFGSFPEATLRGYIDAIEQDVRTLAAITSTPAHYLLGEMINLSADAIKAAEAGLTAKIGDRALFIGEAWEEVMRTALRMTGDPAAADVAAEVVWADFQTRSDAQLADALSKLGSAPINIPQVVLWERYGATQQEVERWKTLRAAELADAAASAAGAINAPESAYARLLAAAGQSAAP